MRENERNAELREGTHMGLGGGTAWVEDTESHRSFWGRRNYGYDIRNHCLCALNEDVFESKYYIASTKSVA